MALVGLSLRLVHLKARTSKKQENWFLCQRKISWTAQGNKVTVSYVNRSKNECMAKIQLSVPLVTENPYIFMFFLLNPF